MQRITSPGLSKNLEYKRGSPQGGGSGTVMKISRGNSYKPLRDVVVISHAFFLLVRVVRIYSYQEGSVSGCLEK